MGIKEALMFLRKYSDFILASFNSRQIHSLNKTKYPRGEGKGGGGHSSHGHKTGSSHLGVLFKIYNEHSSPFNIVVSLGQVDLSILKNDHVRLLLILSNQGPTSL